MYQTNKLQSFYLVLMRLVLVLSILVGIFAILPQPSQAASNVPRRPVVTASINGERILTVTATNLVPGRYYYIRVRSTQASTRIDKVAATSKGKITERYQLTGKLAKANRVTVCLKDIMNSQNYCTTAKR